MIEIIKYKILYRAEDINDKRNRFNMNLWDTYAAAARLCICC